MARQVRVAAAAVERILQHLHAGVARGLPQRLHFRHRAAEVLRNHAGTRGRGGERADQLFARPAAPFAALRRFAAAGDGVVPHDADEVVDAHGVVQPSRGAHAPPPPGKAVPAHGVPVVQRVAPELAAGAEPVRRNPRDADGPAAFVQLKELRVRPDVGAVQRDVEGEVPDDADAARVGVGFEPPPLPEELELAELPELRFAPQGGAVSFHGRGPAQADVLRPGEPFAAAEMRLEGHEKAVPLQPTGVFGAEGAAGPGVGAAGAREGLPQQGEPVPVKRRIVDPRRAAAGAAGLLPAQQALAGQQPRVDEIRVARKRGKALVRAVAEAGRAERQHLPPALPRGAQKIRKAAGLSAERADPLRRRQGKHRQKHPRAPRKRRLLRSDLHSITPLGGRKKSACPSVFHHSICACRCQTRKTDRNRGKFISCGCRILLYFIL